MNRIKITTRLQDRLRRMTGREEGSSTVELAIVFPILVLLFVGTAEMGRLLYTYTTLAKATNVGARYLSTSRNAINGTSSQKANALQEARNLVVCGIKSTATDACTGHEIISGLTTANVLICDNFSTACSPALSGGSVKYFRVEITGYTYAPGVWDLATQAGLTSTTFYFPLEPGTEARSMQ